MKDEGDRGGHGRRSQWARTVSPWLVCGTLCDEDQMAKARMNKMSIHAARYRISIYVAVNALLSAVVGGLCIAPARGADQSSAASPTL